MEKKKADKNIAAYIAGEADKKKRAEMKKEIEKDRILKEQMNDYSKLWDESAELSKFDKIDVEGDWQLVRKRMNFKPKSKKIPFTKYMLRISAILVLAFGLAYFLNTIVKEVPGIDQRDYFQVVAQANIEVVNLPDGSIVTLNKGAKLFYNNNFANGNRDIILEGEAFFDVARNEKIPFKVFVSNSTIEVLGTSFNIKAHEEQVHLSVVTGRVAFFETTEKVNRIDLVKDEMVTYNSKKHAFAKKTEMDPNTLSWRTKKLEFRNVPVDEVFYTIANYYGLELSMEVKNGFSESYTAIFEDHTIEEVLDIIAMGIEQDFSANIINHELVISDSGNNR